MGILKLAPSFKEALWGGRRLIEEYHKDYRGPVLAESWELSCHPDGPSRVASGPEAGMTLPDYLRAHGPAVLGTACAGMEEFPILIKLIDAKVDLSVQVHPDDAYARAHEGQPGKTEMWYVVDCKPGARLCHGFTREVSRAELEERIRAHTLLEVLNAVSVHRGDVFFIPSGTVHTIGANILVAEIQQSSNVTYRLYDYGRKGPDGKERELHIAKALDVARRTPPEAREDSPHVARCQYFTVDRLFLDGETLSRAGGRVDGRSFLSILILDGAGEASCGRDSLPYRKGDSLFLPAGSGEYELRGRCEALLTQIP